MKNDIEEEIVTNESEEAPKVTVPPVIAKYTRPPAFQKQSGFTKWNQNNNNKPVIRKWAGRGR